MSNGKETNEYITQEYAYVSDKGIQTQDYFKKLRRAPDTDARQLRDVEPALNGNNETLMDSLSRWPTKKSSAMLQGNITPNMKVRI